MSPKIVHAAYSVKDLNRSMDFYGKLGFHFAYDLKNDDGSIWLVYLVNEHHQFIELFPGREGNDKGKNETFFHLCYLVEDIETLGRKLQSEGVVLYEGPAFLGHVAPEPFVASLAKCNSKTFFLVDPDGNDIEIMEYTADSLQLAY
jgi:catechol 2,3-dioxygenase-like lactoylglutathione lyase family enzyme